MTKSEATAAGQDMVAKLGEGWTFRIHENMGWHASAYSPAKHLCVSVYHFQEKPRYHCMMTHDPERSLNTGTPVWHENFRGDFTDDPRDSVLAMVTHAREVVNRLTAAVVAVETASADFKCECCGKPRK